MKDQLVSYALHNWFLLLIVGFFGVLFVLMLTVSFWEKFHLYQYQPGRPEDAGPVSGYFRVMNEAAARYDVKHAGYFIQTRASSLYRCCLSLWVGGNGGTLIIVGGGKLAKMDYKRTILISLTQGGREIVTMDDFGVTDLSGIRDIDVVYRAEFYELSNHHSRRLAALNTPLIPFTVEHALQYYENMGRVRAERMVAMGLAKFINSPPTQWRYTLKGALKNTYQSYVGGVAKASQQRDRANRKRPGD